MRSLSAYVLVFREALRIAVEHHSDIFDEASLSLMTKCLALGEESQSLLSRIMLRKHSWVRSSSLVKYIDVWFVEEEIMESNGQGDEENDVGKDAKSSMTKLQDVISELSASGFLHVLHNSLGPPLIKFGDCWDAIRQCLNLDELKELGTILHCSANQKRDDILAEIFVKTKTQKNMWGASLENDIPKFINMAIKASLKKKNIDQSLQLVRVNPDVVEMYRRVQRLVQISSTLVTHGSSTLMHASSFNAPLMVAFDKVRYPVYNIIKTVPLFSPVRRFLQWEASSELRFAIDQAAELDRIIEQKRKQNQQQNQQQMQMQISFSDYERNMARDIVTIITKASKVFDKNDSNDKGMEETSEAIASKLAHRLQHQQYHNLQCGGVHRHYHRHRHLRVQIT